MSLYRELAFSASPVYWQYMEQLDKNVLYYKCTVFTFSENSVMVQMLIGDCLETD